MKAGWNPPSTDLIATLQEWWEPLLRDGADAAGRGRRRTACCVPATSSSLIDFPAGEVRTYDGEPYSFRFDIARELVETVVRQRAVDWSNSLFLSCRFTAWRDGEFNEYVYNFFKSLSVERMRRAEAEACASSTRRPRTSPTSGSATTSCSGDARTATPTSPRSARSRGANWCARCTAGVSTSRPGAASPPTIVRCACAAMNSDDSNGLSGSRAHQLQANVLDRILTHEIDLAFRRWQRATAEAGGTLEHLRRSARHRRRRHRRRVGHQRRRGQPGRVRVDRSAAQRVGAADRGRGLPHPPAPRR